MELELLLGCFCSAEIGLFCLSLFTDVYEVAWFVSESTGLAHVMSVVCDRAKGKQSFAEAKSFLTAKRPTNYSVSKKTRARLTANCHPKPAVEYRDRRTRDFPACRRSIGMPLQT